MNFFNKNNIKSTIKFYGKNKTNTFVIFCSLIISIVSFLAIMLFVANETNYDSFHDDSKRIYRIGRNVYYNGKIEAAQTITSIQLSKTLTNVPEIETMVNIFPADKDKVTYKDKSFFENAIVYADANFFSFFSFALLKGEKNKVLNEPFSVVISRNIADKYFDNENPLGEFLKIGNQSLKVSGVFENLPKNTHLKSDFIISFATFETTNPSNNWHENPVATYAKLSEKPSNEFVDKLSSILLRHSPAYNTKDERYLKLYFQQISDIHLNPSAIADENKAKPRLKLYILSSIAVLILIIGFLNYMILYLSNVVSRTKETAMRLVYGASNRNIKHQYIAESLLISLLALIIAVVLYFLLGGFVTEKISLTVVLNTFAFSKYLLFITISILFFAFLAGFYPALVASRLKPSQILELKSKFNRIRFGSYAVFVQFFISIVLIISTIVMWKQLQYLNDKHPGYDSNNILIVDFPSNQMSKLAVIKAELLKQTNIEQISTSINHFCLDGANNGHFSVDKTELDSKFEVVDNDYCKTFKIELKEGENFKPSSTSDKLTCLVNESFAALLNNNPIGKKVNFQGKDFEIIGVVKNYNFEKLDKKIEPLVLFSTSGLNWGNYLIVKYNDSFETAVKSLSHVWQKLMPDEAFNYLGLKNNLKQLYKTELNLQQTITTFSVLAILLAILGTIGVLSYTLQRKTKEIGIRKVNGAKTIDILMMYNIDFHRSIIMAFVLACPVSYYILNNWLNDFANHITINWSFFALSGIIVFLLSFLVISIQSWRNASQTPIQSLRYE